MSRWIYRALMTYSLKSPRDHLQQGDNKALSLWVWLLFFFITIVITFPYISVIIVLCRTLYYCIVPKNSSKPNYTATADWSSWLCAMHFSVSWLVFLYDCPQKYKVISQFNNNSMFMTFLFHTSSHFIPSNSNKTIPSWLLCSVTIIKLFSLQISSK
jgi:hypothetical protein